LTKQPKKTSTGRKRQCNVIASFQNCKWICDSIERNEVGFYDEQTNRAGTFQGSDGRMQRIIVELTNNQPATTQPFGSTNKTKQTVRLALAHHSTASLETRRRSHTPKQQQPNKQTNERTNNDVLQRSTNARHTTYMTPILLTTQSSA
jgi:hypothetical protein